jgi:hypothetical protein
MYNLPTRNSTSSAPHNSPRSSLLKQRHSFDRSFFTLGSLLNDLQHAMRNPFKKTPLTGPPEGGVPLGQVVYWRTEDRSIPGVGTAIRNGLRNGWNRITRVFRKTPRPETEEELREEAQNGKTSLHPVSPLRG